MIQINIKNTSNIYTLSLNKYESIFSLKMKLQDKIDLEDKYLLFSGNILKDDRSLASYGIQEGSIVNIENELKGGNLLKMQYLMMFGLVVLIFMFFTYLITGFLPIAANIFYFLIKIVIDKLLGVFSYIWKFIQDEKGSIADITINRGTFSMEKAVEDSKKESLKKIQQEGEERSQSYNFLNMIYDAFFFLLKTGITSIFVFTASAGLIWPLFYYRTNGDNCRSLNLAYYVGLVITIIYFIFYGLIFNTLDGLVNAYFLTSSSLPLFMKAIPDALFSTIKNTWDETKFAPIYAIPIVGQGIAAYHEAIQAILLYLKNFLNYQSQYDCDMGQRENNIKELFAWLVYKNRKGGEQFRRLSKTQLGDQRYMQAPISMLREFIRAFKLDAMVRLMNISFNEKDKYNDEMSHLAWYEKFFTGDYWNLKMSGLASWFLCSVLGFGVMTNHFIDEMNGPLGVANMIKSGNISGSLTTIAYLVILILAALKGSMFGINIKE